MHRRSWLRFLLSAVFPALALGGCSAAAGWRLVPNPERAGGLPATAQVQVWEGTRAVILHGVTFTADSLYGIPYHQPLACDSCRVAVARSAVDSLRTGNLERSGGLLVGLVAGVLLGLMTILSGLGT